MSLSAAVNAPGKVCLPWPRAFFVQGLQILFYKRAGFLGIYAHVGGSPVKPRR
jgi:hypothetical protein